MKNVFKLLGLSLVYTTSLSVFAQESQDTEPSQDLVFCTLEHNTNIKAKLTKTNDQLYSFLVMNPNHPEIKEWTKIMDLIEPVVWFKEELGEVADFYSTQSYNYWLRLNFSSNSFRSLGTGEFILPQTEEEKELKRPVETFQLINCTGNLI
jgi:hypothetical protein